MNPMTNVFKDINAITMRDANINLNIQSADDRNGFYVLVKKASPNAFHDSNAEAHRDKCHPMTRLATQCVIKDWAMLKKYSDKPVMWLHGPAGAGKTAIGKSIAEWCRKQGMLIGEFFFLRSDGTRNHIQSLAATMAYRLAADTFCAAKTTIVRGVEEDPHIFSATLEKQLVKLILQPLETARLSSSAVPYVIIIDGLDECNNHGEQRVVLQTIAALLLTFTRVKFLIISRPDPTIAYTFREPGIRTITESLSLSDDTSSVADIHRYLIEKFAEIRSMLVRPPYGEWPSPDDITLIVEKSSGQFILAATVYRYVSSPKYLHKATSRLKDVVDVLRNPQSNNQDHPLRELDALYAFILSGDDQKLIANFAGCCLVYPKYFFPVSSSDVREVLRIREDQMMEILDDFASIFEVRDNRIIPYHASLGDFLFNKSRSGGLLYCDEGEIIAKITCRCLRLIHSGNHTTDRYFWDSFFKAFSAAKATNELGRLLSVMDIPWGAMALHEDNRFRPTLIKDFLDFMAVLKGKKFEDSAVYLRVVTMTDRWLCTTLTSVSGGLVHSDAVLGCIGRSKALSKVHSCYLDGLFQSRCDVDDLWVFMTERCWWNEIGPDLPEVRALAALKKVSTTRLCKQTIKSSPSKSTINKLASSLL